MLTGTDWHNLEGKGILNFCAPVWALGQQKFSKREIQDQTVLKDHWWLSAGTHPPSPM